AELVMRLSALVERDAQSYAAVSAAYKMPKEPAELVPARDAAIIRALLGASEVPLETARACAEVVELAEACAARGNSNAVSDAGVAALLAEAACRGAAYNVRINIAAMSDKTSGELLAKEAQSLVAKTHEIAERVVALVEKAI
ncbi:MAG: cyclodeaminase/cyclohydrolase family protein, partial [Gemmatimonadota bacterium]|nr:cyclodeaminase/cyclohydrolase family protein [Gemmatimonadota bacterium]